MTEPLPKTLEKAIEALEAEKAAKQDAIDSFNELWRKYRALEDSVVGEFPKGPLPKRIDDPELLAEALKRPLTNILHLVSHCIAFPTMSSEELRGMLELQLQAEAQAEIDMKNFEKEIH